MLKKLAVLLVTILTMTLLPAANAEAPIFIANSNDDRTQPAGMSYRYSLMGMQIAIMDNKPGILQIKVRFAGDVNSNSFMAYNSSMPLLRVKILTSGGQKDDTGFIWLDAPNNTPYQGATPIEAPATYYSDGKSGVPQGRQSLAFCKPTTWMDASGSSNWIAFAIDLNCADIPTTFSVTTFIDSDIYSPAAYQDNKYSPVAPMWIDVRNVPRPPKMKNQTVAFNGYIGTQNLDDPQTSVNVTSSLGLPVTVTSLTPTVCTPSINGFKVNIALLKAGTCSLDAFAAGNDLTNPSPHVGTSFTVNPKVMLNQEFYWTEPEMVQVGDDPFDLFIYSSSHLDVQVKSLSTGVCRFYDPSSPSVVTIVGSGTCVVSVSQSGSDKYFPRNDEATFNVDPAPVVAPTIKPSTRPSHGTPSPGATKSGKKLGGTVTTDGTGTTVGGLTQGGSANKNLTKTTTISCKKAGLVKKVTGVKPVCPNGWTKK